MADSRQQRPHNEDERDTGVYVPPPREPEASSPWAPPPQAAPPTPPSALPQEATWQPEEVLTGEIERGPIAQETDIYGNPVPGHYRTGVRYADADAVVDNDHFAAGRTVWSKPEPSWTPEQSTPPVASGGPPVASGGPPVPKTPPTRPTLSSSLRPRGPAGPPPTPSTSGFIPAQRTSEPTGYVPQQAPPGSAAGYAPQQAPPPIQPASYVPPQPPPGSAAGYVQQQPPTVSQQAPPPTQPTSYVPQQPPVGPPQTRPSDYAPTGPGAGYAAQQPPLAPQQAPPGEYAPPAGAATGYPQQTPPQQLPPSEYAPNGLPTPAGAPLAQQSTLSQQFSRRTSPTPYVPAAGETAAAGSAPTSAPPRIAPPPPRKSSASGRRWWVAIGATILAAAIAAGALVGLNLASRSANKEPASLAGASCGGKPVLTVAVAPEFASVVEKASAAIPGAADGCSMVKVAAQEPAATLSQLGNNPPDAWIPPSTAWLRMSGPRQASAPGSSGPQSPSVGPSQRPSQSPGNGLFAPDAVSLARSPVIVAAPKPFAEASGWPDKQLGWTELTAGVVSHQIPKFSMGNPLRDTASLLAVLGVQVAMAGTTKDPGIAQMRALSLRARLADADADSAALLKKAAGLSNPATAAPDLGLFPVTEQQLWQYSRENPKVQLAGIYPADTLIEADYPLALTTKTAGDQARRDIATQLADVITARTFIGNLTDQGFRPAAKTAATAGAGVALAPNATGLLAQYPRAIPLPPAIAEPAANWAQYKQLTFQTLILVDGSGSMNDPVKLRDGTQSTKADLLRLAGSQAAQLYGEETSLAMWLFASPPQNPTAPPFQVAVPFGPVNEKINGVPRRDIMRAAAAGYKAIPTAGTPLYETVLRGVEDMKKRQKPNTVTLVVVLTDGRDEDSPYAMSQQQFLQRLGAVEDRAHPVPVFAIGYGTDADMNGLRQMTKLTGGQAVASNDPGDLASAVAKIFLAAHLR
jgi:hypothetical protein